MSLGNADFSTRKYATCGATDLPQKLSKGVQRFEDFLSLRLSFRKVFILCTNHATNDCRRLVLEWGQLLEQVQPIPFGLGGGFNGPVQAVPNDYP